MPEGPEIRRAAVRLDKVLRYKTIEQAYFGQPALKGRAASLVGAQVQSVTSRGKARQDLTRRASAATTLRRRVLDPQGSDDNNSQHF